MNLFFFIEKRGSCGEFVFFFFIEKTLTFSKIVVFQNRLRNSEKNKIHLNKDDFLCRPS